MICGPLPRAAPEAVVVICLSPRLSHAQRNTMQCTGSFSSLGRCGTAAACCLLPSAACCLLLPAALTTSGNNLQQCHTECVSSESTRFILPVVICLSQRLSHAQTHCRCNGSFSALGCGCSPLLRGMCGTCKSGGSQGTRRDMELAILMDYWGPAWTCGTRDSSKR